MKKLKDILVLIIKCIIIVAVPIYGYYYYCSQCMVRYMSSDSVPLLWVRDFVAEESEKDYKVLILGDSTASTGYIPEVFSDSAINLALVGSGVVDNYYTLRQYLQCNEPPEDIFISFMDYHLEDDSQTIWDVCNLVHKYDSTINQEIADAFEKKDKDVTEEILADYWEYAKSCEKWYPSRYATSITNGIVEKRAKNNLAAYDNMTLRNGRYSEFGNHEFEPDNDIGYVSYDVSPVNEYYLKKIVKLCDKKDINLHIIKLPLPTNVGFSDDYRDEIQEYYDNLLADYENADFYWFTTTFETEFFADIYHMNNHGAFRFSRELAEEYEDVFKNAKCTKARMKSLDADICSENYFGELTKWVSNKKYTIIALDGTGYFMDIYYPYVGHDEIDANLLENEGLDNAYYVSYEDDDFPTYLKVEKVDNGIKILTNDENEIHMPSPNENDVHIAVIDNANKEVVCLRKTTFDYDEGFTPLENIE